MSMCKKVACTMCGVSITVGNYDRHMDSKACRLRQEINVRIQV